MTVYAQKAASNSLTTDGPNCNQLNTSSWKHLQWYCCVWGCSWIIALSIGFNSEHTKVAGNTRQQLIYSVDKSKLARFRQGFTSQAGKDSLCVSERWPFVGGLCDSAQSACMRVLNLSIYWIYSFSEANICYKCVHISTSVYVWWHFTHGCL